MLKVATYSTTTSRWLTKPLTCQQSHRPTPATALAAAHAQYPCDEGGGVLGGIVVLLQKSLVVVGG